MSPFKECFQIVILPADFFIYGRLNADITEKISCKFQIPRFVWKNNGGCIKYNLQIQSFLSNPISLSSKYENSKPGISIISSKVAPSNSIISAAFLKLIRRALNAPKTRRNFSFVFSSWKKGTSSTIFNTVCYLLFCLMISTQNIYFI